MIQTFEIKVDEALRNETEAAYYETETASRNAAIALARATEVTDAFGSSFMYQWERLIKYAKVYENKKGYITEDIVDKELEKRGIKNGVNWNLDFESAIITVNYDDGGDDEGNVKNTHIVIDCPDEYVKPVEAASIILTAYDTLQAYISRNSGAGISKTIRDELHVKQSAAYEEFVVKRTDVENAIVKPYLGEHGIDAYVNWELKYATKKITISY